MRKVAAVVACTLAGLALPGTAAADLSVGVTDDRGKYAEDGGRWFFDELTKLGMTQDQVTVPWDPQRPATIVEKAFLDRSLPVARALGIRIVFAVSPAKARALSDSPDTPRQFVSFLRLFAETYMTPSSFSGISSPFTAPFTDIVVGNEFNQPRFFQPQFTSVLTDCKGFSGGAYAALLADAYDALKAVSENINVITSVSPRGNDNCHAANNISTSPVRFIHDMGVAYRASERATAARCRPLADDAGLNVYPRQPTDSLLKGYQWPNVGIPNLDRFKQAWWDAFHGTCQPTFAESGRLAKGTEPSAAKNVQLRLGEVGWEVAIVPSAQHAYTGRETVQVTDEAAQAQIYGDVVRRVACDPDVESVQFFLLMDDPQLEILGQAGLIRADGTKRPAYDAVQRAIAETRAGCTGTLASWRHTESVDGAAAEFGDRTVTLSAQEDANGEAGIFRVASSRPVNRAGRAAIGRALAGASPPRLVLSAAGFVKAYYKRLLALGEADLGPGYYVYAARLTAALNPERASLFVSKPFTVGNPGKSKPGKSKKK